MFFTKLVLCGPVGIPLVPDRLDAGDHDDAAAAADKSRKVRGPPSGESVAAVVARGEAEISQVGELIQVPGMTFVVRYRLKSSQ